MFRVFLGEFLGRVLAFEGRCDCRLFELSFVVITNYCFYGYSVYYVFFIIGLILERGVGRVFLVFGGNYFVMSKVLLFLYLGVICILLSLIFYLYY